MNCIRCKEYDHEINYKPTANFIVFCPKCLKYTCEYGFGPVTPCYIYLGNKEIGIVTEEDINIIYKPIIQTKWN